MARDSDLRLNWFDMPEIPYRASRILKALGNPKTFSLVQLLLEEPVLDVTQMARKLDRSPTTVSKILRPLRDLEVVRYQRKENHVLYTLKDAQALRRLLGAAESYAKRAAKSRARNP